MQTNPESAAVEAVAWLVTNGGETCEPWLVYERNEVEALPASCIADPLYPQSALDALRGEVAAAERRVAELEAELTKLRDEWQASLGWKGAVVHGTRANIGVIADALTKATP